MTASEALMFCNSSESRSDIGYHPVTMLTFILDTNVVLDWLVFRNHVFARFTEAVQTKRVNILTHVTAGNELRRVLNYPALKLETRRQEEVYSVHQSLCREAVVPAGFSAQNLLLPEGFPNCRDPDDQLFLALTLHTAADALVTRDKAVLALRKKARKFGVTILDVEQLQASVASVDESGANSASTLTASQIG